MYGLVRIWKSDRGTVQNRLCPGASGTHQESGPTRTDVVDFNARTILLDSVRHSILEQTAANAARGWHVVQVRLLLHSGLLAQASATFLKSTLTYFRRWTAPHHEDVVDQNLDC